MSLKLNGLLKISILVSTALVLANCGSSSGGSSAATPALVTSASVYPQNQNFNPNVALAGMGNWVNVNGVQYFVPTAIVTPAIPTFTPYQNGYWATTTQGLTWMSNDPWGWVTDHYGLWRHHEKYGWIWSPFQDHHYEPSVVTWMDHYMNQAQYIGWYPYSSRFESIYAANQIGFNDGFWPGSGLGSGFGPAYPYQPGFAIVPALQLGNTNLATVILAPGFDVATVGFLRGAFTAQHIYPFPGATDLRGGLNFVNGFAKLPPTTIEQIPTRGGAPLMQAKAVYPQDKTALNILNLAHLSRKPLPIGSSIGEKNGFLTVNAPKGHTAPVVEQTPAPQHIANGRHETSGAQQAQTPQRENERTGLTATQTPKAKTEVPVAAAANPRSSVANGRRETARSQTPIARPSSSTIQVEQKKPVESEPAKSQEVKQAPQEDKKPETTTTASFAQSSGRLPQLADSTPRENRR